MSSDEELYLIEEILNQRRRKRGLEYLVRWKGYNERFDTWEPAAGVEHCSSLIQQFLNKRKSRSRGRGGHSSSRSRSRSRTQSPGRRSKPRKRSRSRSRSATRKPTHSTSASAKLRAQEDVLSSTSQEKSIVRSRQEQGRSKERKSEDIADKTGGKASTALKRKAEIVGRTVETVRSAPAETELAGTTSLVNVILGRVQNGHKPTTRSQTRGKRGQWLWKCADYATLAVFLITCLGFLFYIVSSCVEMLPGALQSLGDSYRWLDSSLSQAAHKLTSSASAVYSGYMQDLSQLWMWASGPHVEHDYTVKQAAGARDL